ncbi:VOC family protein [Glaciihabitans arcticus]|uniref:VOC family protein n=1 Tax=Glaciihabitans arcticus TaxID=2668039 RepID=A0A4Q9GT80_9MICO|nr:VOC family protein [Glaciihabitans arcticus]TBN56838.1 VOC family protein [Glaciihabitans arcticus]
MAVALGNFTFYADDPVALSAFWSDVFGYPRATFDGALKEHLLANGLTEEDLLSRGLAEDPEGRGPRLFFHHADGPKVGRNRIHFDINAVAGRKPTTEEFEAEKDRIVGLGASVVRLVEQEWGPWPERYYQMRDPEGNEFCLQG